jgi:hypothetical protein
MLFLKKNKLIYSLGSANFGNNENFHLLHFAVLQTNDRKIEYISDFIFCLYIFFQNVKSD